jgi:hypothetical protein
MTALRPAFALFAFTLPACDANVVDAVRRPAEPPPVIVPVSPRQKALIHRYGFDGTGTTLLDSKGAAHGEVIGAELPGYGALPLAGGEDGPYVNLPNGLISGLTDATVEAWVTWNGGAPWQRIFDFGNTASGEDGETGAGTSYLFLTASSGVNVDRNLLTSAMRAAYAQDGISDEEPCQAPAELPIAVPTHVALVVDQANQSLTLYQDGAKLVTCPLKRPLAALDDVNNWLGRSNYSGDDHFGGIFDEFRIYSAALDDEALEESADEGPDAEL